MPTDFLSTGFRNANHPMPSDKIRNQKLAEKANELYWSSGRSVNQLAQELDLSKSVLYSMVRPLSVESPCPVCRTELVFANRTAMEKTLASCPGCDFSGPPPEPNQKPKEPSDTGTRPWLAHGGSGRLFWGSVLLGIAASLFLVSRRR